MKPFYITLPSGGEGNKTSSFTVNLPYEVDLHGSWEVALVDVIYPTSWYNVYEGNRRVVITGATEDLETDYNEYNLALNYYDKVDVILEQLNVYINDFTRQKDAAIFRKVREFVSFSHGNGGITVSVHEELADMLGYESTLFKDSSTGKLHPSLNMQNMYVYTDDLIEPQIVGDVRAELLCIIPAEARTLKSAIYSPHHLHYLPVTRNNFNSIKIDIRDVRGNHVPFSSGHSVVKLHFRPV